MKMFGTLVSVIVAGALLVASFAVADDKSSAVSSPGLATLKKLAGDWVEIGKDGKPTDRIVSSIRVTAGGTAVQETIFPGTDHEMVTMYHQDGKDLVLTHYCILGNQPQMRAQPGTSPNRLVFKFSGGTNLKPEKDAHMHEATLVIVDDNHIQPEWTKCEDGKPCDKVSFNLARKQK
jgi:hypothetical protein